VGKKKDFNEYRAPSATFTGHPKDGNIYWDRLYQTHRVYLCWLRCIYFLFFVKRKYAKANPNTRYNATESQPREFHVPASVASRQTMKPITLLTTTPSMIPRHAASSRSVFLAYQSTIASKMNPPPKRRAIKVATGSRAMPYIAANISGTRTKPIPKISTIIALAIIQYLSFIKVSFLLN